MHVHPRLQTNLEAGNPLLGQTTHLALRKIAAEGVGRFLLLDGRVTHDGGGDFVAESQTMYSKN